MITILDMEGVRRAVRRLASEVVERNKGTQDLVIVGIRTRGVVLARRIAQEIKRMEGVEIPVGVLDVSLFRDDLLSGDCEAVFKGSEIGFKIEGKNVALCDDVMYTGRTVRSALAALATLGRPKTVRLYTLADRGHRELPFRPDGVGKNVPTAKTEKVLVHFEELDGEEGVFLIPRE